MLVARQACGAALFRNEIRAEGDVIGRNDGSFCRSRPLGFRHNLQCWFGDCPGSTWPRLGGKGKNECGSYATREDRKSRNSFQTELFSSSASACFAKRSANAPVS